MAVVIEPREIDAVIFDLDGVITRTAEVHAAAWTRLFDEYLEQRAARRGGAFRPFEHDDYLTHVDGKPRYDGVDAFLRSRGVELPWGEPGDGPDAETVCGLGNRKNAYFLQHLRTEGVEAFDTSVALVRSLQERGLGTALISASRNAADVLEAAGLGKLFPIRVDGEVTDHLGLAGKPDPAVFLEAARRLGVEPARAVVVEDALSGVEAGRRGGFGVVIGVDRAGQSEALREYGADVVVPDLDQVEVGDPESAQLMSELPVPSAEALADRLRYATPVLAFDYDGTLTPIVAHPDLAVMSAETRLVLEQLAAVTTVAVLSGRDVADVMDKMKVGGIYYAGSHGFDIVDPEGRPVTQDRAAEFAGYLPDLDAIEGLLRTGLRDVAGANVERKRFALAVHYRQVDDDRVPAVRRAVEEAAPNFPSLRVSEGKKVFEVRPDVDWDKGRALRWILAEMGLDRTGVMPVYFGDDTTDEDAFAAIRHDGLGIAVGKEPRPTLARFALPDPAELRTFLERLLALLPDRR